MQWLIIVLIIKDIQNIYFFLMKGFHQIFYTEYQLTCTYAHEEQRDILDEFTPVRISLYIFDCITFVTAFTVYLM